MSDHAHAMLRLRIMEARVRSGWLWPAIAGVAASAGLVWALDLVPWPKTLEAPVPWIAFGATCLAGFYCARFDRLLTRTRDDVKRLSHRLEQLEMSTGEIAKELVNTSSIHEEFGEGLAGRVRAIEDAEAARKAREFS